jgi:hypothetical protein
VRIIFISEEFCYISKGNYFFLVAILFVLSDIHFMFLSPSLLREHYYGAYSYTHTYIVTNRVLPDTWSRLEILTEANNKITIFWNVTPCNLVDHFQGFGETFCFLLPSTLKMEA